MRTGLIVVLMALPNVALAAAAPDWRALADCAAAYSANAKIADPDRAPSMKASISELADDYAAAAVQRRRRQDRVSEPVAAGAVRERMATREAAFAAQPRADVERFIDACPQPDA